MEHVSDGDGEDVDPPTGPPGALAVDAVPDGAKGPVPDGPVPEGDVDTNVPVPDGTPDVPMEPLGMVPFPYG